MKQLDEPESTKPLKTPKIPDKCKMTYKAFADLVLVALSFSMDFQGSEQQLSPPGTRRTAVSFFDGSGSEERNSIKAPQASAVGKFLAACLGQFLAR